MDFVARITFHASIVQSLRCILFYLDMVAYTISIAFVGVVAATDARCATADPTLNGPLAEDKASLLFAPTSCGLTKWFDIASDEEDPILQSLPLFPSSRILIPRLLLFSTRGAGYTARCPC